jgi:hypothetical protein
MSDIRQLTESVKRIADIAYDVAKRLLRLEEWQKVADERLTHLQADRPKQLLDGVKVALEFRDKQIKKLDQRLDKLDELCRVQGQEICRLVERQDPTQYIATLRDRTKHKVPAGFDCSECGAKGLEPCDLSVHEPGYIQGPEGEKYECPPGMPVLRDAIKAGVPGDRRNDCMCSGVDDCFKVEGELVSIWRGPHRNHRRGCEGCWHCRRPERKRSIDKDAGLCLCKGNESAHLTGQVDFCKWYRDHHYEPFQTCPHPECVEERWQRLDSETAISSKDANAWWEEVQAWIARPCECRFTGMEKWVDGPCRRCRIVSSFNQLKDDLEGRRNV